MRDGPHEPVQVGSQTFDCQVQTIDAPRDFPEWGRPLSARVWFNEALPGSLAGYELTATVEGAAVESAGRVTEYRVVLP